MLYNLNFTAADGSPQHYEFVSDYDNDARAAVNAILYDWPDATDIKLRAMGVEGHIEPYDVAWPREVM